MLALRRPRFSLPRRWLTTALACVLLAHWWVVADNQRLLQEAASLSNELGELRVDNPRAAYVLERPDGPWGKGRDYRVYLPTDHEFELHVCEGPAGIQPIPRKATIPYPSGIGRLLISVTTSGDQAQLSLVSPQTEFRHMIPLERAAALPELDWFGPPHELDPNEPVVLLDHQPPGGGDSPSRLRVYFTLRNHLNGRLRTSYPTRQRRF